MAEDGKARRRSPQSSRQTAASIGAGWQTKWQERASRSPGSIPSQGVREDEERNDCDDGERLVNAGTVELRVEDLSASKAPNEVDER